MDASTELRAVLDAARLRAEGIFTPMCGRGGEQRGEASDSAAVDIAPCSLRELVAWADAELCDAQDNAACVLETVPLLPPLQSELGQWAQELVQGEVGGLDACVPPPGAGG